jgi:hypothetical protein
MVGEKCSFLGSFAMDKTSMSIFLICVYCELLDLQFVLIHQIKLFVFVCGQAIILILLVGQR